MDAAGGHGRPQIHLNASFRGSSGMTTAEHHQAGKVKHKPTPSKKWLRENYDYNASLGKLARKATAEKGCRNPYETTQGKAKKRRLILLVGNSEYKHARLVWAWHNDDPGPFQVDHIDGETTNDRIENLRLATNSQNNANKKHYKGYRLTKTGRFFVDVMKGGKHYRGGTYTKEEDAIRVANALRKALHGEFAITQIRIPSEFSKAKAMTQMPLFDSSARTRNT
jgi:hypothetical protein